MSEDILNKFRASMLQQGYSEFVADFFCEQAKQAISFVDSLNNVCNLKFNLTIE